MGWMEDGRWRDGWIVDDEWMNGNKASYTVISCLKTLSRKDLKSDFK